MLRRRVPIASSKDFLGGVLVQWPSVPEASESATESRSRSSSTSSLQAPGPCRARTMASTFTARLRTFMANSTPRAASASRLPHSPRRGCSVPRVSPMGPNARTAAWAHSPATFSRARDFRNKWQKLDGRLPKNHWPPGLVETQLDTSSFRAAATPVSRGLPARNRARAAAMCSGSAPPNIASEGIEVMTARSLRAAAAAASAALWQSMYVSELRLEKAIDATPSSTPWTSSAQSDGGCRGACSRLLRPPRASPSLARLSICPVCSAPSRMPTQALEQPKISRRQSRITAALPTEVAASGDSGWPRSPRSE
mmetsp:Transcript_2843/g.6686  ORF Transcript_2843/g.6686 Transcript_2843/m.6686 type:complete len:311 (+) Transcript_2843:141-1073(+)